MHYSFSVKSYIGYALFLFMSSDDNFSNTRNVVTRLYFDAYQWKGNQSLKRKMPYVSAFFNTSLFYNKTCWFVIYAMCEFRMFLPKYEEFGMMPREKL